MCVAINWGSIKQCVEPESTSALKIMRVDVKEVVMERKRASGSKGAEMLRRTSITAQSGSTQPMVSVQSPKGCSLFFESSAGVVLGLSDFVLAAQPFALAVDEEDFRHSLAVCPTPPQKRQRLLAKRRAHSTAMSLPSFPSLLPKSNVFFLELWVDKLELFGVEDFFCCLFWLF